MYLRTFALSTLVLLMFFGVFLSLVPTMHAQTATCVGTVPQNAHIYPGDDQGLTQNTALGYRVYNEPSIKCDYTCNDGYIWDAATWTCNPPGGVYTCAGSIPSNASMWDAEETTDLNFATSWAEHTVADTPVKCQFRCNESFYWNGSSCQSTTCSAGFFWNGNGCFPVPTGPRCTGSVPENGIMFTGIDNTVSVDTPITYSAYDTDTKCQFSCKEGYDWDGVSRCVIPGNVVTYSCTGNLPENAEGYGGDTTGLIADNSWVYTSSNTGRSCEFFCKTGYRHMASSNTCELIPGGTATTGTAGGTTSGGLINPNACSFRISIPNAASGFVDIIMSMIPWR
jgi:hypothetical protein